MRRPILAGIAVGIACIASTPDARAWYFPEHVVIATDAVNRQAPEIRAI